MIASAERLSPDARLLLHRIDVISATSARHVVGQRPLEGFVAEATAKLFAAERLAADIGGKNSAKKNWAAHALFVKTIGAWKAATGHWPVGTKKDGEPTAPLFMCVDRFVLALTDDESLREGVTAHHFEDALRSLKDKPRKKRTKKPRPGDFAKSRKSPV